MEQVLIISSILLWVIVLLNLLLTLALVRRPNRAPDVIFNPLPVGQPAPDFTAETLQGEQVTLATYAKRTLALVFISPTCGHCRAEIPLLEALRPRAQRSDVELVLVSDADIVATRAYVDELKISLPVLVAPRAHSRFLDDYKVDGTPFYYIIGGDGNIQSGGFPAQPSWRAATEQWGGASVNAHQPQISLARS